MGAETFKGRLKILMKGERPYTWAKKIGIEKGLFQYYWQKGKTPGFENLLKIAYRTGCSLDWLLTGRDAVLNGQVENLRFRQGSAHDSNRQKRMIAAALKIQKLYGNGTSEAKLQTVEGVLDLAAKK